MFPNIFLDIRCRSYKIFIMLWLNFLHFYQPANADFFHIRQALDKSYWRLIRLLEEHPDLRFTVNISGCLLERLLGEKETAFIDRLRFLVKKGRVELTGSAAYHGFLPLLPEAEVIRQIKTNEKILKKCFGKDFKPRGFFLPEMAYSPALSALIKRAGYSWIILDEFAYRASTRREPDPRQLYIDAASGLKVVFRQRDFSNAYPPDKIGSIFKNIEKATKKKNGQGKENNQNNKEKVFITATDAELYGLRHEDHTAEMEKIAKIKELKTMTLSKFIGSLPKPGAEKINLKPSTWESSLKEIKRERPYLLWQDKNNKIQVNLWKLAYLALAAGEKFKGDQNFYWYRWHLVRGLASCVFWWASAHDFSRSYGPYAWSPDQIESGLEDLVRSVRSFADPKSKKIKLEAEAYYLKIKKLVWEEHWRKHWRRIV